MYSFIPLFGEKTMGHFDRSCNHLRCWFFVTFSNISSHWSPHRFRCLFLPPKTDIYRKKFLVSCRRLSSVFHCITQQSVSLSLFLRPKKLHETWISLLTYENLSWKKQIHVVNEEIGVICVRILYSLTQSKTILYFHF